MSCTKSDLMRALGHEAWTSRSGIAYHDALQTAAMKISILDIEEGYTWIVNALNELQAKAQRTPEQARWLNAKIRGYQAACRIIDAYYCGEGA